MLTAEQYGRYEIKSKLGQGGMATVYLAHDPRFGRDVALKVMNQGLRDDPTFRGRFEREARTVAGLEHPAIVPVYDFGEEHDRLYLVMRYMPGGSLVERIGAQPLTLLEIVPIFQRIGSALDHAHRHGVIHRDLKPANILFDQYNHAFLSDFGIVKLATEATDLTGSGVIGTPAYMSPEQIHGEKQLDGRSDIYTLGIILFESLTGRKPYHAETPVKQMMAHVLDPVPSILQANPNLPPICETVIQKALAKERDGRYPSASEFTAALTGGPPPPIPAAEPDDRPETTALDTLTAAPLPPSSAPPLSSLPHSLPPASILVSPPPPRTEPPTSVGTAALTFERPPPSPAVPAAPTLASRRRPWLWPLLVLILLLIVAGAYALSTGLAPATPTQIPVVAAPVNTATPAASATATPPPPATAATSEPPFTPAPAAILATPVVSDIGRSALNTPLQMVRFGVGESAVLLVGGLHAGFAPGSVQLAEAAIDYFREHPEEVPATISLYIVPNANPDSMNTTPGDWAGRLNGNGVDLNRNWDCRWLANPLQSGTPQPGAGGAAPFSEPEVRALVDFIQQQPLRAVVFWQARAAGGLSSPGACSLDSSTSRPLAQAYGRAAGYHVTDFELAAGQVLNGDATNWLDAQGIPAISVLLPNYNDSDVDHNLPAILAIMEFVTNQ